MTAQKLDRTLSCYRIGDPEGEFPIFDAAGSTIFPGRWNDVDTPVIYTAEHYSTAMLEKLAHGQGIFPPNQHFIEIQVPKGCSYEVVTKDALPKWADADEKASRAFGVSWVNDCRSLLLIVPSYVARVEKNIVINPAHQDFRSVETSLSTPVWWDERLFPAVYELY